MKSRNAFAWLLSATMAVSFLIGPTPPSYAQTPTPAANQQQQFNGPQAYKEVFDRLSRYHIDLVDPTARAAWIKEWENKYAGRLNTEDETTAAINEMIHSLGQIFDSYMLPEDVQAMQQQSDPSFAGIGIEVQVKDELERIKVLDADPNSTEAQYKEAQTIRNDTQPFIVANDPMENLPAEKAGLQLGDAILEVDGTSLDGKTSGEAVDLIRGKIDTDVVLKIRRADDTQPNGVKEFDVTIKRAKVTPKVVKVKDLGDGVTHVRLFNFMSDNLESEMVAALQQAAKGKAIVFDLRGNGGGRLDAALNVLNYFVEDGTILVQRERNGDGYDLETTSLLKDIALRQVQNTTNPSNDRIVAMGRATMVVPRDMPVVVLINGGSASASEIVSGSLQHLGRARIIGTHSLGKGVGQAVMPLSFDRAVRVTTFEFLPGGDAMNQVGIIPDVVIEMPADERYDPNKDSQLDAAKAEAMEMLADAEARAAAREESHKEYEEFHKKIIEAQKKKP